MVAVAPVAWVGVGGRDGRMRFLLVHRLVDAEAGPRWRGHAHHEGVNWQSPGWGECHSECRWKGHQAAPGCTGIVPMPRVLVFQTGCAKGRPCFGERGRGLEPHTCRSNPASHKHAPLVETTPMHVSTDCTVYTTRRRHKENHTTPLWARKRGGGFICKRSLRTRGAL